jgi:hypothetical protein
VFIVLKQPKMYFDNLGIKREKPLSFHSVSLFIKGFFGSKNVLKKFFEIILKLSEVLN